MPLLDAKGEIRLARGIEQGRLKVQKALATTPWLWKELLELQVTAAQGRLKLRSWMELVGGEEEGSAKKRAEANLLSGLAEVTSALEGIRKATISRNKRTGSSKVARRRRAWRMGATQSRAVEGNSKPTSSVGSLEKLGPGVRNNRAQRSSTGSGSVAFADR